MSARVVVATFKTKRAADRELAWWLGAFPEQNPVMVRNFGWYYVARDFVAEDAVHAANGQLGETIEVTA